MSGAFAKILARKDLILVSAIVVAWLIFLVFLATSSEAAKVEGYKKIQESEYAANKSYESRISHYSAIIDNGLYVDGVNAGTSPRMMIEAIDLFSYYGVDFQKDITKGDKFEAYIRSLYSKDGQKVSDNNSLLYRLVLRSRVVEIYVHQADGSFYDEQGKVIKISSSSKKPGVDTYFQSEKDAKVIKEPRKSLEIKPLEINSVKLTGSYLENGIRADLDYKNKLLRVVGVIDKIQKDHVGNPYIELKGASYTLTKCLLLRSEEHRASNLRVMDKIMVEGKNEDGLDGYRVTLTSCKLIEL